MLRITLSLALAAAASGSALAGGLCNCPADFTGDGAVDGADLGELLAGWNSPSNDLTGDNITDGADLGELLAAWGPCGGPANDECSNSTGIPVTLGIQEIAFCTVGASTSGPTFSSSACGTGSNQIYNDIWYSYTPLNHGELRLTTCNDASFDTVIAVYKSILPGFGSCPLPQGQIGFVSLVGCNDDADGCSFNSSDLNIDVLAGFTYTIRLGGFSPAQFGVGTLTVAFESVGHQCFNPINAGNGATATVVGNTSDNPDSFDPPCSTFGPSYSEWIYWTAPANGFVDMSLCHPETNFDTVLAVYRGTLNGCNAIDVACNDDATGAACDLVEFGSKSKLSLFADQGLTYVIQVTGWGGATGAYKLTISQ